MSDIQTNIPMHSNKQENLTNIVKSNPSINTKLELTQILELVDRDTKSYYNCILSVGGYLEYIFKGTD